MAETVDLALVGYGYWGPNLLRNFAKTAGCNLVCCCDLDEKRLEEAKKNYPSLRVTKNYREILRDEAIKAIIVATPTRTHYQVAKEAIERGKDVLIEKPMVETSWQAKRLNVLAKRKRRIIMVDHIFLFNDAVRKMKEYVDSGELGKVLYVDSERANLGIFQDDVNVIYDLAVHDLSMIDYILNKRAQEISCFASSHFDAQEDVAYINLQYGGRLCAHISVSWLSPLKIRRTIVVGTERMIVYDETQPSEKLRVYDKGVLVEKRKIGRTQRDDIKISYRSGDVWMPKVSSAEPLSTLAGEFVEAVKTRKSPVSNGVMGGRMVELIEKATEAARKKKLVKL